MSDDFLSNERTSSAQEFPSPASLSSESLADLYHLALELGGLVPWEVDLVHDRVHETDPLRTLIGGPACPALPDFSTFLNRVHPQDRKGILRAVLDARASRSDRFHEYRVVWPDGSVHWIEGRGRIRFDDTGKPLRFIGVARNIDARKAAEQEAAEKLEAERQLTQQMRIIADVERKLSRLESFDDLCRSVIETGRELLGFDRLGLWFLDDSRQFLKGSYGVDEYGQIQDERKSSIPASTEQRVTWVLDYLIPVFREDNTPLYNERHDIIGYGTHLRAALWDGENVIGLISMDNLLTKRPVSEQQQELFLLYAATVASLCTRLQMLQSLRESEGRFRVLFEHNPLGIGVYTAEGAFIYANPAMHTMFGYSTEELATNDYTHPDDVAEGSRLYKELVNGKRNDYSREKRYLRKDGSIVWMNLTATGIRDKEGALQIALLIHEDITERKRLQEQYLHAQKMEMVGQLAAGVAHDFNNLLTVILGFADLAEVAQPGETAYKKYITHVKTATNRAADLTRQLLAFARKQHISPRVLNLGSLISDLTIMLRRLVMEHTEIRVDCDAYLWPVFADAEQMEHVLINLIASARDRMPDGGAIVIKAENRIIQTQTASPDQPPSGRYVQLTVHDNGRALQEEALTRIFEPFYTTKELGHGAGLGLATCYGIIAQSEGYIDIASKEALGTTVTILLPRIEDVR